MPTNKNYAVSNVKNALNQMKVEIASSLGVTLGPDTSARQNGSVGGEITRQLVNIAEQSLGGRR